MATRRERVILDLQDDLTPGLARAAVASRLLKGELDSLGRDSTRASKNLDRSGKEIDKFSGRLSVLRDTAILLGPALVPLGAAAIPALTGALSAMGAAAGGIGVSVLALKGVGDALKALDAYQLEPTAENLQAVRIEMEKLGPAGAHFAAYLDSIEDELRSLQIAAREGLLPGLEDGIDAALERLPGVRKIVRELAQGMGELATSAGEDFKPGGDWDAFFRYLDTDGKDSLVSFGNAVGDITNGLADMMVAFAPVNRDFVGGFEAMAQSFADWAAGLDESQDFQEFLDYIRTNGPRAIDMLGSLAHSLAAIVEAAAPVGAVTLPVLTKFLDVIGAIADSPVGTPFVTALVAVTAYRRAVDLATASQTRFAAAGGLSAVGRRAGFAALAVGVFEFNQALYKSDGLIERWTQQVEDGTFKIADARAELAAFRDDLDSDSVPEFVKNLFDPDVWADVAANILGVRGPADKLQAEVDFLGLGFKQTGDLSDLFAESIGVTGEQLRMAAGDAEQFSGALARLDGWLSKRGAIRGYREAIQDLAKGLKDGFNREDREQIDATAESIAQVAAKIKDRGLRADFLANARASLAEMAQNAAPKARREIEKVIAKLDEYGLTQPPEPELDADDKPVTEKIKGARRALKAFEQETAAAGLDADANPFYSVFNPAQAAANRFERTYTARLNVIRTYKKALSSGAPDQDPGTMGELVGGGTPRTFGRGFNDDKAVMFSDGFRGGPWATGTSSMPEGWIANLADAANGAAQGLKGLKRELRAAEKAVERERRQRDKLQAQRAAVSGAISSDLSNDLFAVSEGSGNPWAAGASPGGVMDPLAAAQARRDRARRFIAAIRTLKGMGLDKGALSAIISEGLEAAEFMAAQPQAYVSEFAATLAEANQFVAQAANMGANAVVSVAEMNAANAELREANQELRRIRKAVENADKNNQHGHQNTQQATGWAKNAPAAQARRRAWR